MDIIPSLVHPDQVGFVKGRQAPDATRRLMNLIGKADLCRTTSLLFSFDAEKVFDRDHWGFLEATLHMFRIQGWLCSAIMSLYAFGLCL